MRTFSSIFLIMISYGAFAQQEEVKKESSDTTKIKLVCVQEIGKERPQYIVDGIEVCPEGIAKIDPWQIESIQVLKGTIDNRPDGERNKNGVILIEMKTRERNNQKDKLK